MQANELRYGNFLRSLNEYIVRVIKIEATQLTIEAKELSEPATTPYSYIKPLRLTTEILTNSGFANLLTKTNILCSRMKTWVVLSISNTVYLLFSLFALQQKMVSSLMSSAPFNTFMSYKISSTHLRDMNWK